MKQLNTVSFITQDASHCDITNITTLYAFLIEKCRTRRGQRWNGKILFGGTKGVEIYDTQTKICSTISFTEDRDDRAPVLELRNGNIVGTATYTILVWDVRTKGVLLKLEGHNALVQRLCELRDGNLISTGNDFTARIWNINTGRQLVLMQHEGYIWSIIQLHDDTIALSGNEGYITIRDLRGNILKRFFPTIRAIIMAELSFNVLIAVCANRDSDCMLDLRIENTFTDLSRTNTVNAVLCLKSGLFLTSGTDSTINVFDGQGTLMKVIHITRNLQDPYAWMVECEPDVIIYACANCIMKVDITTSTCNILTEVHQNVRCIALLHY
jgi:WD40 repeat protein